MVVIAYTPDLCRPDFGVRTRQRMLGYRRIFQMSNVSGAVAFLCVRRPDYGWLLGARVLQGVGAALLVRPATATGLYRGKPGPRSRHYTMMFGIGSARERAGRRIVQYFDWRSVFWFRAPIAAGVLSPGRFRATRHVDSSASMRRCRAAGAGDHRAAADVGSAAGGGPIP